MYLSKMKELVSIASISLKSCVIVLIGTYTVRMEDKVNQSLKKLKECDAISDSVYKNLYASDASPGILNGLPLLNGLPFSIPGFPQGKK